MWQFMKTGMVSLNITGFYGESHSVGVEKKLCGFYSHDGGDIYCKVQSITCRLSSGAM